jgi:hypothetical protein
MNGFKLSHAFVIGFAGILVVMAALALSASVSAEALLFYFVLALLNLGLPIAWLFKHREQISTLRDVHQVVCRTTNRNTIARILIAALLLPMLGMLAKWLFNLSTFTYSRIVMLAFVGALYWILLGPGGDAGRKRDVEFAQKILPDPPLPKEGTRTRD